MNHFQSLPAIINNSLLNHYSLLTSTNHNWQLSTTINPYQPQPLAIPNHHEPRFLSIPCCRYYMFKSYYTIIYIYIYIYQPLTIKVSKIINHSPLTIIMISTISPTKDVAGTVVTSVVEQQHKVLRSGPTRLKDLATPRQMGRSPDHGEMIYGINIIRKKHNNMCIFLTIYIYIQCVYIYILIYSYW